MKTQNIVVIDLLGSRYVLNENMFIGYDEKGAHLQRRSGNGKLWPLDDTAPLYIFSEYIDDRSYSSFPRGPYTSRNIAKKLDEAQEIIRNFRDLNLRTGAISQPLIAGYKNPV